ncbi:MAG TPA: hypothetical protein PKN95_15115 [Verrucomicrobiota bacterium]|nr:hypothetical protein [Verrucomicrobiota bacterium]HNT14875.1 hypothetical protein [Verrucomicrobiota bacterium]
MATTRAAAGASAGRERSARPGARQPCVGLLLCFLVAGWVSLFIAVAWMVVQPSLLATYHYNQFVIAATHLVVLGFVSTIIMGTLYQLAALVFETELYSLRLAKWQFVVHLISFAGMIWMFRVWDMKQVGHFGSGLALGVALWAYNLARTLWRMPKWNVIAFAVASAGFWFGATVFVGLSVAAAKCAYDATDGLATVEGVRQLVGGLRIAAQVVSRFDAISLMHAHVHLGVVGFFLMLIVGLSYRLIPMFALTRIQSSRRALLSIALLNLGVGGAAVSIALRSGWKLLWTAVILAGLFVFAWELRAMLKARTASPLDWGLKSFLVALGLLVPVGGLAVVLAWPALPPTQFYGMLENVYGFVGLFGVVTLAIFGMLHKILPLLVWLEVYCPHAGRARIPAANTMVSEPAQFSGLMVFLISLLITSAAILLGSELVVRVGAILLLVAVGLFAINLVRVLIHYFKPEIKSLSHDHVVSP